MWKLSHMHTQTRGGGFDPVSAAPVNEHPSESAEGPISIILHICLPCSFIYLKMFARLQFLPLSPPQVLVWTLLFPSLMWRNMLGSVCDPGGERIAFCFTGVNTEPFVLSSSEVLLLVQSLSRTVV